MNQSKFIKESHINERLIRAVVRQIGGWEEFKERAPHAFLNISLN